MEQNWEKVKNTIRTLIPGHSYRMWMDPLELKADENGELTVVCPNAFSKKRVCDQYAALIESELHKMIGKTGRVRYAVSDKPPEKRLNGSEMEWQTPDRQLSLPNLAVPPSTGRLLRHNFTFDRFVVSRNSHFAYSAAFSIASKKPNGQNSLFLLSSTGMGKTHLSQAVGHHILAKRPAESVYYVTAEDFTNEMVHAFRNDALDAFKEKYRTHCDVLILEDVHFLTGKDRTQIELALALDYLMDADKKIIFTSCYPPGEIPKLNEQLRSRLACGLIPNIEPPDYQARIKILRKKALENHYDIPEQIIDYLAMELDENVRQLESGLIGVTAKSSLMDVPIDLKLAESVVRNIAKPKRKISIERIKEMVCKHYKISVEEIVSRSRKQNVVRPRHVAIFLSRKYTNRTLQEIGKSFNRYHATALRSISTIERGIKADGAIRDQVRLLSEKLEAGDY